MDRKVILMYQQMFVRFGKVEYKGSFIPHNFPVKISTQLDKV